MIGNSAFNHNTRSRRDSPENGNSVEDLMADIQQIIDGRGFRVQDMSLSLNDVFAEAYGVSRTLSVTFQIVVPAFPLRNPVPEKKICPEVKKGKTRYDLVKE